MGAIDVLHYDAAAIHALKPKMETRGSGSILLTDGGFDLYPDPDYLSLNIGKAGLRTLALGLFESAKQKNDHIATVTVCKFVSPETEDTRQIAERFWQLHVQ